MPRIFVILLNYNGEKDTLECLASLGKITYKNYAIIVVDNGSRNGREFLKRVNKKFPEVITIPLAINTGFSGGNNMGIRYALAHSADYILLLNNDTTVATDFLTHLINATELDKRIGIVGAKIYFSGTKKIWYNGGIFSWFGGGKHIDYNKLDNHPNEESIKKTDYVTGCTLLIKREVIEKIGLLEEAFFLYYEDVDLCLRARKAGYRLVVAQGSHVWHKISQTTKKLGEPCIQYYHFRNALLLSKRNAPRLFSIGIYFWSLCIYIKQLFLSMLPSKRANARAIMRGIQDFYKGNFGIYKERGCC